MACRATRRSITLLKASLGGTGQSYPFDDDELVPLRAGERIAWRLDA